jgi:Holliday junction resolvase
MSGPPVTAGFLDERRLLWGPWQAFEREVARLLLANGFDDVRIVGSSGDHGGDVLGVQGGELWVFQCKHTTLTLPPREAIAEIVEAARFYKADRMVVATSRPPGDGMYEEQLRYERNGLKVQLAGPANLLELMRRTPEYPTTRRVLRPYQEDTAVRFREALLDTGRAHIVLATGLGKTVVMAEVVADLLRDGLVEGGRVLVLAHTRELVDQLHRSFWYQLPKWVVTHQLSDGETPTFWEGVTFATIQSARSRIDSLPAFGLILVDEAHHIGADMFRRAISALQPKLLGGVTATPWRGDGFDIEQVLGPPLVRIGIAEGLARGFLAEVDYRLLADNVDWEFVQQASAHSYPLTQLNRKLILPTRDEEAVRLIRDCFDR